VEYYLSCVGKCVGYVQYGKCVSVIISARFRRSNVIKIKLQSQELFSELELPERTITALKTAASQKFNVSVYSIERIIKDQDVV
jgi:hypothetical protein